MALKDAAGKTATFEYDTQGRRMTIVDRLGGATKYTYHTSGKIASVTNARGDTITYTYTPQEQSFGEAKFTFHNLTKVDYPDKASEQFTYDAKGNIVTMVDRAGQTWKYTYNARGLPLTMTNPANGVTTFAYNADMTLASTKDSDTGEIKYGYDALKRLTKITYPDNSVIQFAYDANDRITSITDENNRVVKFEYDANGNLVKIIDANNKATAFEYDPMDRIVKVTNRVGQFAAFTYDALGRLASVTDPTGIATQYGYDPRGQGSPSGGWLNAITRAGNVWKLGYDDEGIVASVTSPLGNVVKFQNDKLGMLASATDALGNPSTLTRDAINRITGAMDSLKRESKYGYDTRGLLNSVTQPVVGAAKYERDALGNLTKITDLNGQVWSFAYSPMGRLQSATDPLKQSKKYAYDNLGRVSQITYADGVSSAIQYDAAGNPTRVAYSDGAQSVFAYDAENNLIRANDVALTRDAEGRVINTLTNTPPVAAVATGGDGGGYGATYDAAGRLKTVTYAGGLTVTYTYDAKTSLLASVSDSLTKAQVDFTYDKDNRLIGIARSNKVNTTLTWDNAARLTRIEDRATTQGSPLLDLQYTLDAAGQVTQSKITAPLDPSAALAGATTQGATTQGATTQGATTQGATTQGSPLQFDAASQISTAGYSYDARGRLTQSPAATFKWNGASQLVGIGQTTLTYNGLGDVASRGTTQYAYNYALGLAPIVAEISSPTLPLSQSPTRHYIWSPGGTLLYAIEDGKPVFYHFDRTGSTLALTDADGKVTDAYAYDPFGALLGHTGKSTQPFTFAGKWGVRQESATLYHVRARYYDAATARFTSPEPLWPQIDDPLLLNPYGYAYNNPLKYVDVDGLTAVEVAEYFEEASAWNPFEGTAAEKANVRAQIREFLGKEMPGLLAKKEAAMQAATEAAAAHERTRIAKALTSVKKISQASMGGLGKQAAKAGWNLLKQVPDPLMAIDLLIQGDIRRHHQVHLRQGGEFVVAGSGKKVTRLFWHIRATRDIISATRTNLDWLATVRYAYNYALGLAPIVAETDDANKPLRYYAWSPI